MTAMTIADAKKRIEIANPSRPLAAFRTKSRDYVDIVFADTVVTQMLIKQGDRSYLGSFHRENLQEAQQAFQEHYESLQEVA